MARSSTFTSVGRQRLLEHPTAKVREDDISGPLSWLNPTRARFDLFPSKEPTTQATASATRPSLPENATVEWRARDNRKGRHALVLPATPQENEPKVTSSFAGVRAGIWRMFTVYAWWDVSWWIGVLFSVGSAIFIVCGFFYWLPLAAPSSEFKDENTIAGGLTSFIGATLFQIGAVLLIVEACNENQSGCFGWALEHAFAHSDDEAEGGSNRTTTATKAEKECIHHQVHGLHKKSTVELQHPSAGRKWEWWPTWRELKDHYFHEIGFLASFILAVGATVFYISGIMAMPWIYNSLSQGVLYGVYWLAYLVGGILFVVSSVLYVFETQPRWYQPAPKLLGWWIGVFNLIGSVGWALSASFGYCSASWCAYQSNLSLTWASIAFTIGSLLLWYEALDKYPVERERK